MRSWNGTCAPTTGATACGSARTSSTPRTRSTAVSTRSVRSCDGPRCRATEPHTRRVLARDDPPGADDELQVAERVELLEGIAPERDEVGGGARLQARRRHGGEDLLGAHPDRLV